MAAYLNVALEEGDLSLILATLGDIARVRRMALVAQETGLGRESLYKSLSPNGNPEFATVLKVVRALNFRLQTTALWGEFLQGIDRIEVQTAFATRARHAREFKILHDALEQLVSGWSDLSALPKRPKARLQVARGLLIVRTFNSVRTALQVLELGYCQQAMALVRMAVEDQLVADDIEHHPPTLAALLDGDGQLGKGELTFGRMAERLSPKAKAAWDARYGMLSEHGAHPRLKSMLGLVATNPSASQRGMRPGSHYDALSVRAVLLYAAQTLVQAMATFVKLADEVGLDWAATAMPAFKAVDSLWKELDAWASDQLERLDQDGS